MPLIMNEARLFVASLNPGEIRRSSDFQVKMVDTDHYSTRFVEAEYQQQKAYMESRIAFAQIAREVAPSSVVLSYAKAVPFGELQDFAENMFGIMLVFSDNGMNYHFTRSEDAIFFKLTYR
jgi:hypothetical protein